MKGYAKRIESIQEYYFSAKLREVNQFIAEGKPVINLGIGSPDLAPADSVTTALKNAADQSQAHGYQPYQGIPELRTAMAAYYQQAFEVHLNPIQEILPLMGSKEGIMQVSLAFLNPGDEVLIPNPGYPTYRSVTELLECTPIDYEITENGEPDWHVLESKNLTKVKIMWVNYPHMPTGIRGNKELFEKLVRFAEKHQILLINDNPYSHILNSEPSSLLKIPGAKEVAMELNSLSKTFNIPGWRVGMLCGKKEWVAAVLKVKSNMDSGMFLGIQKGAIAALTLPKSWFEELNQHYESRRKLVWQLADSLNLSYSTEQSGLFVWCQVPEGKSADDLVDFLLYEKNIFITPGHIFGSKGTQHVRISLCLPEFKILEAIKRIKPNKS
ncbi:aminotransferase class I/II-fold pyridoxal phosphate-dependent enzyme [Algoriphagus sp.]|uniref:pyridoxal phosphate-dependent aminotransferase n=1 Tax=Algoriphagus sp. TaxID=1872435 RepID=UPI002609B633|nr:aminotransferase class I/II-fold pyridoxal phosphate-dependent enzyme [Algoriphagus sp.]